jgi:protein-tyrosine sulfotransferase
MHFCQFLNKWFKFLIFITLNNFLLYLLLSLIFLESSNKPLISHDDDEIASHQERNYYERPIIFIGGFGRSGTTLMRAIIGSHPDVACGPETKIIPELLEFIQNKLHSRAFIADLSHAGITEKILDMATANFIHTLIELQNGKATFQCAKDPNNVKFMIYLKRIFPNAKIVYMVRDGRDVSISFLKQYNESLNHINMIKYMSSWRFFNKIGNDQCKFLGNSSCMVVKYEDLVLDVEKTMRKVAEFLNLRWSDNFKRHESFIGNKVKVSNTEWSTNQIKKQIYKNSMKNWVHISDYNSADLKIFSEIFKSFGYLL